MADCINGCSGVDACLEGQEEQQEAKQSWKFVGDGRGAYERVQTYNYVGAGGNYEREVITRYHGWRPRLLCIALFLFAVVILAVACGAPASRSRWTNEPGDAESHYSCVLGEPFQSLAMGESLTLGAVVGLNLMEATWLLADRDGDGLAWRTDVEALQDSGQLSARAAAVLLDARQSGSVGHSAFLAALIRSNASERRGFEALTDAAWMLLDADADDRVTRQELSKLRWQQHLPKEALAVLFAADVDRSGALDADEFSAALRQTPEEASGDDDGRILDVVNEAMATWSSRKRSWCCQNAGIGCKFPSSGLAPVLAHAVGEKEYDCQANYDHWHDAWTPQAKEYCCKHYARGCPVADSRAAPDVLPYDCSEGYARWRHAWSRGKQDWCCRHTNRGCEARSFVHTSEAASGSRHDYDCQADLADWRTAWSYDKQSACCKLSGVACAS